MTRTAPKEIKSLQAARGIAALLVVIVHSSALLGQEITLWQHSVIYKCLRGGTLGVQMFFVISGFVIFHVHRSDLNQPHRVRAFWWKRFRRVYPLYWIFLSLIIWKHHALTDGYAPYRGSRSNIVSSYLLLHLFSSQTIMAQAWTLFDEVQFYLVFALCIINRKAGLVMSAIWLAASFLFLTPASPYWKVFFSPYHLLFGFGILVALILQSEVRIPAGLIFWVGTAVFVGAFMIMAQLHHHEVLVRLIAGAGAASALLGAAVIERQRPLTIPRWLALLADASYSIYLVHFMVIFVVNQFCFAHWRHLPVPLGVWMVFFILVGVSVGIATHYAIERPLLKAMGKRTLRV